MNLNVDEAFSRVEQLIQLARFLAFDGFVGEPLEVVEREMMRMKSDAAAAVSLTRSPAGELTNSLVMRLAIGKLNSSTLRTHLTKNKWAGQAAG